MTVWHSGRVGTGAPGGGDPAGGREGALVASTHLFRFRSYRDAARSLFVQRRRLGEVEGLRFARLVFAGGLRTEGFSIGVVDPRRQLAMCLWESEEALERFLRGSRAGRGWLAATDEYCEIRLVPFRSHGSYRGMAPLAGLEPAREGDGPVALWTFADIPPRGLAFFWNRIRGATRELLASPGLVAGTAGPEHLYRGAMTFTIWESLDDALAFSYRRQPHKGIVKAVREDRLLRSSMFVRLRPYAVTGAWPARSRFATRFERFRDGLGAP